LHLSSYCPHLITAYHSTLYFSWPPFLCSPCFFSLLLLPPRSTLFPYTTLFRSCLHLAGIQMAECCQYIVQGDFRTGVAHQLAVPDRKSTRLNSSHVSISYAVFCLKKKIERWWMFAYGPGETAASVAPPERRTTS